MIRVRVLHKNVYFNMDRASSWTAKLAGIDGRGNVVMEAGINTLGVRDITLYRTVPPKDFMDAMNQVVRVWEKLNKEV